MMLADLPTTDELLKAALEYASLGWAVVPCHTPINGICDCSAQDRCESPGKHPWTKNGLLDATTDELKIRRWWKERSIANIALAVPEGYIVVDVDGEHGFARLQAEGKHIGTTAAQTSGRGHHYVFRTRERIHSRNLIPPSEKGAHDGIDLKGPGGYIMAAPSLHASGRVYEWAVPLSQVEIAPPWLEEVGRQSGGTTVGERAPVDFGTIMTGLSEGQRKWELFRAASKLRGAGVPIEIAVTLVQQAASNCRPPLEAKEAERKVREAYSKFPPNAEPRDMPAGVTLLSYDSVMVEFQEARFVFSDLEKAGRELHAEMEVKGLLPATPTEPYVQRFNLLSVSAREACRRELDHVLGKTNYQWTSLLSRAVTQAQNAYLSVDRSVRASEIEAPDQLEFVIPDLVADDGLTILFGAGSGGKTFLLMKAALAVSRGDNYLGRPSQQRKVLYIDCETGRKTFGYRMRRLCAGEGLGLEAAADVFYWWAGGIPLEDQVDAIRRCCDENQIGFLCLDHIAAACGGDASEQAVASRFSRALGKLNLPMLALAHITGADMRNPESVQKPFGSIFWENNARRTIFVLRQQDDNSPVADLGLYPKKVNDGGKPSAFGVRLAFDDPSGPITVDASDLRANSVLSQVRGLEHVIWDLLSMPMEVAAIAEAVGKNERTCKDVMKAHPRMFTEVAGHLTGGRGQKQVWSRTASHLPYADDSDDAYAEVPF